MEIAIVLLVFFSTVIALYALVAVVIVCDKLLLALAWCARMTFWAVASFWFWLWAKLPRWGAALRRTTARWTQAWAEQVKRWLYVKQP